MSNLSKQFIDQIADLIEGLIKNANLPTVVSCRIISYDGNGKYTVERGDKTHKVEGALNLSINSVVQVILPNGKWKNAIILSQPH